MLLNWIWRLVWEWDWEGAWCLTDHSSCVQSKGQCPVLALSVHGPQMVWLWDCVCVWMECYAGIYMGSSSVLVLIDSHSLCNSFVVNQFLFFTPNGENSLCYTPKKQWEQYGGKKMFCLFFISKIYSHDTQKWRPKMGMAIPYCLFGSYFIPDKNIQTYLICLQSCNMQKHQKANFRTAEYVCVQQ